MEKLERNSQALQPPPSSDHQFLLKILRKLILVSFALLWAISCNKTTSPDTDATMASIVPGMSAGDIITVDNPLVKRFSPTKKLKWVLNKGKHQKYDKQKGVVSYYHRPQEMANGEQFDPEELTAAHTSWPLHSIVRCTRVDNGRSVEVMITDRGPYIDGRILDLSRAAGRKLRLTGADGIAKCVVEMIAYPLEEDKGKSK